jgi:hypothetical protein
VQRVSWSIACTQATADIPTCHLREKLLAMKRYTDVADVNDTIPRCPRHNAAACWLCRAHVLLTRSERGCYIAEDRSDGRFPCFVPRGKLHGVYVFHNTATLRTCTGNE